MAVMEKRNAVSKGRQVEEALKELAIFRGPGIKLPTIRELCVQLQTCRPTLERALSSLEQRDILRRKHGSGIYVSECIRQKTIGVVFGGDIFSSGFSPYWGLLLKSVREQTGGRSDLRAQAYMDISQGHDGLAGHTQLVEDLEAKRLDGILLFGLSLNAVPEQLGAYGVPLVVSGAEGPGWRVTGDAAELLNLFAGELAARKCRHVVLMQPLDDYRQPLEDALRRAGVPNAKVSDSHRDLLFPSGSVHEQLGYEVMQRILSMAPGTPLPDAVVCIDDDTTASGAITALLQAGLKLGKDIQIASKVNKGSPLLSLYAADMIQIEIDPAEEVGLCLEMLETLMAGGTPERNPVWIKPKLVRRTESGRKVGEDGAKRLSDARRE